MAAMQSLQAGGYSLDVVLVTAKLVALSKSIPGFVTLSGEAITPAWNIMIRPVAHKEQNNLSTSSAQWSGIL